MPVPQTFSTDAMPGHETLVANLAALWASDPKLARQVETLHAQESYAVQPTRAGVPTAGLCSGNIEILLHSRHQPLDEANRLLDGIDFTERTAFHVFGFGLGYHVERLFDRAGPESVIFVYEPDLLLLRTAMEQRDFTRLFDSRRVLFFTRADKAELFVRLTLHMAVLSLGAERIEHGPSLRLRPEFHTELRSWLDEFDAYARTSVATLVHNGRRTAENIARNIGWYAATPSVARLRDRHKGAPAIVVSAGPSLRKNKHLLKGLEGRAIIVAVQTTLQPLLEIGVEPHYVTSLDYHDICTRFFEKLPKGLRTELIAEPKATNAIFSMHPGPLTLLGSDFAESLLREIQPGKEKLPSGATVAHLAYYLAEHMGCDPIVFVGQDLGFSDGLCYAPGTSYDDVWRPELSRFCTVEMKQWEQIVRDRKILRRLPDQQGAAMYTEERLFTYLQQFERDFLRSKRRIIDATEGGARKRGATPMALAQAIEQYCTAPLADAPDAPHAYAWSRLRECAACLRNRAVEARQIERISRATLDLLAEVRSNLHDQPRVNRAIACIDTLRSEMGPFGETYDLVTQLSQRSQLRRLQADRRIAASGSDGTERQRRQVERDMQNVAAVVDAAAEFAALMDCVIARLEGAAGELMKEAA